MTMHTDPKRKIRVSIGAAFLLLIAWVGFCYVVGGPPPLANAELAEQIARDLTGEGILSRGSLEVRSADGIVTLIGTAPNLVAREQAAAAVAATPGIRAVLNNLVVLPGTDRPDSAMRADIYRALAEDPSVGAYRVAAHVVAGTAVLVGEVHSYAERELVAEVVRGVHGLRMLLNEIEVVQGRSRSDQRLWSDIRRLLLLDSRLARGRIDVTVKDGHVMLAGVVSNLAQRSRAVERAWIDGVRSVDVSHLHVAWEEYQNAIPPIHSSQVDDATITAAVKDALLYDPRIHPYRVHATADAGTITLTGRVSNYRSKAAAEDVARNTYGVWMVKNQIEVRPQTVPIEQVLEGQVQEALARDAACASEALSVAALDGVAYLGGEVASPFARQRAEQVVSRVPAITGLVNKISCEVGEMARHDQLLAERVRGQLAGDLARTASNLKVGATDGVVTLSGRVQDEMQSQAMELAAYEAGAVAVHNRLKIGASEDDGALAREF